MNKNSIELTGFTNNVKKISDKLTVFSLAVGMNTKEQDQNGKDIWKNGFVDCKVFNSNIEIEDGKRVSINGWVAFDFYESKEGKERNKLVVNVKDIELV
jgi:single-stranded DNA-binding protein